MLYVVNSSTLVTDADVATMTRAVAHQLRWHLCPAWDISPTPCVYVAKDSVHAVAAPGSVVIAVLDDSDQADALGWHTENQGDVEFGRVFARPVLEAGGSVLTGALTVASVLSHEACEWRVDRHCNLWADRGDGTLIALEVGDPVESDSYPIAVIPPEGGTTELVGVSNFVYPAWFDPATGPGKLDHLGRTTAPFQLTAGGYAVTMHAGATSQIYGESYPAWRRDAKLVDTARTARRIAG